jgi:hypothetical protein
MKKLSVALLLGVAAFSSVGVALADTDGGIGIVDTQAP